MHNKKTKQKHSVLLLLHKTLKILTGLAVHTLKFPPKLLLDLV